MRLIERKTYKHWLVVWLLMWGCVVSSAATYQPATAPSTWSSTPTTSEDVRPSYQFHSTSSTPMMGSTRYSSTIYTPGATSPYGPRKVKHNDPWSDDYDPEGNPRGEEIGQVDTPIGDITPWMVMAGICALIIYCRERKRKKV